MTAGYGAGAMPEKMSDNVMENEEAADCLLRGSSPPFSHLSDC